MTIDELEDEINELEEHSIIESFDGSCSPSDSRRLIYLYQLAKKNDLKIFWWPKAVVIPGEHYSDRGGIHNLERFYKAGVLKKNRFSEIRCGFHNHIIRPLRILRSSLGRTIRFMTNKHDLDDMSEIVREFEDRERLNNLETDLSIKSKPKRSGYGNPF